MSSEAASTLETLPVVVPELCLVLLVGPSGCGKSTLARQHFRSTEILSSDVFRGLVCDNEANQAATADAFEVLHLIAEKRLRRGRLTVIDATNLRHEARKPLLELARKYYVSVVALAFDLPVEVCRQQNLLRTGRVVEAQVVQNQAELLPTALADMRKERIEQIIVLRSLEEIRHFRLERQRLNVNRRGERGPFDIIGDVHGCFGELLALLLRLGYHVHCHTAADQPRQYQVTHPQGRRLVFVGDLVDRGPNTPEVLRLVMAAAAAGQALCVLGNHDDKLLRRLKGRDVKVAHGLAASLQQLQREPAAFKDRVRGYLEALPYHLVLDHGRLVVAHAGLKKEMHGRISGRIRSFALFGDTTGAVDEFGLPIRNDWAADYTGRATIVYGHTPVQKPQWFRRTINIDTGCVFGGRLTALRYPELELVSVPAQGQYFESPRPLRPPRVLPESELAAEQMPPLDEPGDESV